METFDFRSSRTFSKKWAKRIKLYSQRTIENEKKKKQKGKELREKYSLQDERRVLEEQYVIFDPNIKVYTELYNLSRTEVVNLKKKWIEYIRIYHSPRHPLNDNYKALGVSFSLAWRRSFAKFLSDVLSLWGYSKGRALVPINPFKNFNKKNAQWLTNSQRAKLKAETCKILGLRVATLREKEKQKRKRKRLRRKELQTEQNS